MWEKEIRKNIFFYGLHIDGSPTIDAGIYYLGRKGAELPLLLSDEIRARIGASDLCLGESQENGKEGRGYLILSCLKKDFCQLADILNVVFQEGKGKHTERMAFVLTGDFLDDQRTILYQQFADAGFTSPESEERDGRTLRETQDAVDFYDDERPGFQELTWAEAQDMKPEIWQSGEQGESMAKLEIVFEVPAKPDEIFAAVLLGSLVGTGDGSRLGMQLREEYAYTDEVWADIYNTQNGTICIVFNLYARIKWIREILQISWNILTQMKKELTEREFRAEQKIYIRGADWMLDDSYDMNKNMGILFQTNAWEGWDPEYWKRMYESVSLRQLKELAGRIFTERNRKIYYMLQTE